MPSDSIKTFVQELLTTSGLVKEGENFDEVYVEKMAGEVEKYLGLELMKKLDEQALLDYAVLVDDGAVDPDKAKHFFAEHIPDFEVVQKELFEAYAKRFFERTEAMKQSLT